MSRGIKYEIKTFEPKTPYGDNLGVFRDGKMVSQYNTLSNDYAYSEARRMVDWLKMKDKRDSDNNIV